MFCSTEALCRESPGVFQQYVAVKGVLQQYVAVKGARQAQACIMGGEGGKRDVGTDVKTYLHASPGPKHGRGEVTVYSEHLDSVVQFCERDTSTIGQHLSGEKSQRQV